MNANQQTFNLLYHTIEYSSWVRGQTFEVSHIFAFAGDLGGLDVKKVFLFFYFINVDTTGLHRQFDAVFSCDISVTPACDALNV